MSADLTTLQFD